MSLADVASLIAAYRYGILIPLSLIEGPIVSFISGTLASTGYFNIWFLFAIFLSRDIVMDGAYYAIGRFGWQNQSVERLLGKLHVHEAQLDEVRNLWERHPFRTILIGKLSYGLAITFIMVVGMVKIPLLKFYKYSIWVSVMQFGALITIGYFFGATLGADLAGTVQRAMFAVGGIAAAIVLYYLFGRHMRQRLLHAHEVAGLRRPNG